MGQVHNFSRRYSDSKIIKTYILAGQSNALGWSTAAVSSLSTILKSPVNHASIFNPVTGKIETLLAGSNNQALSILYHGIEVNFCYQMTTLMGEEVCLIKYGVGGTYLANDGTDNCWAISRPTGLYNTLKTYVTNAIAEALSLNITLDFVAMLWYQGEADAQNLTYANAYNANLTGFIAQSKIDFGISKFVIIRVHDIAIYTYSSIVRAAQNAIATGDSDVDLIDTDPYEPTVVHPNSSSYNSIGLDCANLARYYT
jgi:hypothetical protein